MMFYRRSKFMLVESYALEFNDSAREAAAAQGKDSPLPPNAPYSFSFSISESQEFLAFRRSHSTASWDARDDPSTRL